MVLPDDLFATVETPRDLLGVLAVRPPDDAAIEEGGPLEVPGEHAGAPEQARTLLEALQWHVQAHPDRVHANLATEARSAPSLVQLQEAVAALRDP